MKKLFFLTSFLASLLLFVGSASANFTGTGSGTTGDPYLISTCLDLQSIGNISNADDTVDKIFWLANDIDCSGTANWNDNGVGGYYGFNPIAYFYGTLDGRGHSISNLYINRPEDSFAGLFGNISYAMVANLRLSNVSIVGNNNVGALAASADFSQILNVAISGEVTAASYQAGGLIGISNGNGSSDGIFKSSFQGTVRGGIRAGGIIGYAQNGWKIEDSFASSTIEGRYAGGLIGEVVSGCGTYRNMIRSYMDGVISSTPMSPGDQYYSGGFVGRIFIASCDPVAFTDSFAVPAAIGGPHGGLIGTSESSAVAVSNSYFDSFKATTTSCVSNISGGSVNTVGCHSFDSSAGGQENYLKNSITDGPLAQWDFNSTWATSTNFPTLRQISGDYYTGPGQVQSLAAVINERNNVDVSWNAPETYGSFALANFRYQIKRSGASWDNPEYYGSQTETILSIQDLPLSTNYDVRVQAVTDYGAGEWQYTSFSTDDPIVVDIDSCSALQNMPANGLKYDTYRLTQNIDCSDINFTPLSWGWNGFFQGVFDGQGHSITNLNINQPDSNNIGLFSAIYNGGLVEDLILQSGNVMGYSYVGAVAGYAEEGITIRNVTSSLSVGTNSGYYIGGLIGDYYSEDNGIHLEDNQVDGSVSGYGSVGGLVGYYEVDNYSDIESVISGNIISASVQGNGNSNIGGLIGYYDQEENEDNLNYQLNISNNKIVHPASVSGNGYVGGLFGYLYHYTDYDTSSTINFSDNSVASDITGSWGGYVGGLIGYVYSDFYGVRVADVINLHRNLVKAEVTSYGGGIGGLVGEIDYYGGVDYKFNITDSSFDGLVAGDRDVGGLIGYVYDDYWNDTLLTVDKSYAVGSLTCGYDSGESAGGLVGYNYALSNINNSFSANTMEGCNGMGTIVGFYDSSPNTTNVYFDQGKNPTMQAASDGDLDGVTAINTGTNPDSSYFFNNSTNSPFADGIIPVWDFINTWQVNSNDYPTLRFYVEPPTVTDLYVDRNYSIVDAGGHTWGQDAFNSITAALNAAEPGNTIHVNAGLYEISSAFTINIAGLRIIGPGIEAEDKAILRNTNCGIVFDVSASGVTIEGLQMEQSNGSYCLSYPIVRVGSSISSTTIRSNEIVGGDGGVALRFNSINSTVTNNKIHDNDRGVTINGSRNNIVENNEIYSNSSGIYLGCGGRGEGGLEYCDSSLTVIRSNNIHNNSLGITFYAGDQEMALTVGPGNIITANGDGIYVSGNAYHLNINGNSIYNNVNPTSGLHVENAMTGLDASNNWWGDPSGPTEANGNPDGYGDEISLANSQFVFYRPFYTDERMTTLSEVIVTPDTMANLFIVGTFVASTSDFTSVEQIEATEEVTISVSNGLGFSTVVLPAGTVITKTGGGSMDGTAIGAADVSVASISGFGAGDVVEGALQWGIPEVGLTFNPAITLNIFVGTDLNGQTLSVKRSLSTSSGWVDDGIVDPKTCVVTNGVCTFQATKASYFAAAKVASSGGGSSGGGGGGGVTIRAVEPSAKANQVLGFTINNGEKETTSSTLTLHLNADSATTKWFTVSLDQNFTNASLEAITDKTALTLPSVNGNYTVYLKYLSTTGKQSAVFSRNITLAGVQTVVSISSVVPSTSTFVAAKYKFKRTLKTGSKGADVKELQKYLNSHGFVVAKKGPGSPNLETTSFGNATKSAVIKLQEKYANEILTRFGLKKGTGIVGSATLKLLNK